jgi:MraZ protein
MFLGEYEHSVDVKGRVAVPAKFRTQLEGGLVVTRGFERCLQVYPMEQWQALSERVSSLSLANTDARQLRRLLFASAFDTELDKQGRILLPSGLREYAAIGDVAVVAGMNTYFEIWSQDSWDAAMDALDEDSASTIAAQMAEIGI